MHQSDLDWYVANHPGSELAKLASGGAEFTNNHTSDSSDSDPGGTALMTGADPKATGIYYDDEQSHGVFPPGTTKCSEPVKGGNVIYDSPDDILNAVADFLNNGTGKRCSCPRTSANRSQATCGCTTRSTARSTSSNSSSRAGARPPGRFEGR